MKFYIIAGEASGDLHGSNLVKGLLAEDSSVQLRCWGGPLMQAAGGTLVRDYKDTAVMGFSDVVRSIGKIRANLAFCRKDILEWQPDVVVLIDYPGFNMKIARFCHSHGIRVFYYIPPKTWASREGRNRRLKEWTDSIFVVFPFEIPYFQSRSIPFVYKGNPLIDAVDSHEFRRPCAGPYIAILPGSRKSEISHTMPNAMKMADTLHALPQYASHKFLIAAAPRRSESDYAAYTQGRDYVQVLPGRTYDILKFADAALINSGTASLEAALIGTPQLVCWSTQPITVFLARHLLRIQDHISFISLGNLILGRQAFRELIQEAYTPESATAELRRLLEDAPYREKMLSDYAEIRRSLGTTGASRAIAKEMIALAGSNSKQAQGVL